MGLLVVSAAGFAYNNSSVSVSLNNSIVSGNLASSDGAEIYSYSSIVTTNQHNLFGHSGLTDAEAFTNFTPGASDIKATSDGTNVGLSNILIPLANNGGKTFTHALVQGSPAIDAADDAVCAAVPINNMDQRGWSRPVGAHCDIGAFEFVGDTFFVIPIPGKKAAIVPL